MGLSNVYNQQTNKINQMSIPTTLILRIVEAELSWIKSWSSAKVKPDSDFSIGILDEMGKLEMQWTFTREVGNMSFLD